MFSLSYSELDLLAVACGVLLLCYLRYTKKQTTTLPLPPGPKPLPIIGNMRDLPSQAAWETYNRWAEEYGDIVHVSSFGSHIIILNAFKTVYELLERRSSIYSGRPYLTMFHELMHAGGGTPFIPYGRVWRKHRTFYHRQMNQTAVKVFQPAQLTAARGLLRLLLECPDDYVQHIRHMAAGVAMGIAYGKEISLKVDPFVATNERISSLVGRAVQPGGFLVDIFPILKYVPAWVPGAGFQRLELAKTCGTREKCLSKKLNHFSYAILHIMEKYELIVPHAESTGNARPSFVANALTDLGTDDESNEDVDIIKRVAGSIFGAGSDTTTAAIRSFILAMILHPEIQQKAQAELDSTIGQERLPEFSDRPHLPYLEAIVKEVFRWIPVAPTGIPHVSTEDDIYEGYSIPVNSVVIPNSRRILHDPDMYPNPSAFCPERFLPDKFGNVARDPAISGAFGFGRRVCAGRNLADASVWIAAASILSVFNTTTALDECGRKIDVSYACDPTPGFFSHPRSFECLFTPRSSNAEATIRRLEQS